MSAQTVAEVPVLRVLPIPVAEPRPALRVVRDPAVDAGAAAYQGVLALHATTSVEPHALPATGPRPAAHTPGHARPGGDLGRAPDRPQPPPPGPWVRQFLQAALEVAAGRRSPSQLLRWASEDVFATLARRATLAGRVDHGRGAARTAQPTVISVRSVRVTRPTEGVVEAAVVVTDRGRIRAVALRIEATDGRWRATALEIG